MSNPKPSSFFIQRHWEDFRVFRTTLTYTQRWKLLFKIDFKTANTILFEISNPFGFQIS